MCELNLLLNWPRLPPVCLACVEIASRVPLSFCSSDIRVSCPLRSVSVGCDDPSSTPAGLADIGPPQPSGRDSALQSPGPDRSYVLGIRLAERHQIAEFPLDDVVRDCGCVQPLQQLVRGDFVNGGLDVC